MFTFERPWEYWQMMLAVLRFSNLPYCWDAAAYLQAHLDKTPADQQLVRITFRDEIYHRSIFATSLQVGDKLLIDL